MVSSATQQHNEIPREITVCLPDGGIDTRTPRNFLMRAERKALSFFALRKTQREQIRRSSQDTKHNFLVCVDLKVGKKNIITAQLRQHPSYHISS